VATKLLQARAEPVDRPSHEQVEATPVRILQYPVECGPLIAALPTRNTGVSIDFDDLPIRTAGNFRELRMLRVGRLFAG
jgi:hypothetical protein